MTTMTTPAIDPATNWPTWPDPPAIGSVRILARKRAAGGREICHGASPVSLKGVQKWGTLQAGSRVRVVSHTQASAWYGKGCYVTPVSRRHPFAGWTFFVRHEDLQYLKEPSR